MTDIKRREFLQAAAAASALGAMGGPAEAAVEGKAPGKLSDIDHFIILMKENRSFDHYFGALAGVRGFDDPRRPERRRQFGFPPARSACRRTAMCCPSGSTR